MSAKIEPDKQPNFRIFMSKNRPSWDDYFMAMAKIVATRSTCDRLVAGTVLVKNNRLISSGYNGSPPGLAHCNDVGHLMEEGHCVRTVHSEHNAILQAATIPGASTEGSTMYTKYSPCIHCSKYIVAAGIKRLVISKLYRGEKALEYLKEAKIQVDIYQRNPDWEESVQELFADDVEQVEAKEGNVELKNES